MTVVCELQVVGKRYGRRGPWIVEGASAQLQAGQAVRLAGVNGAGKSTLLRLIAGATRPSTGTVRRPVPGVGFAPDALPHGLPIRAATYLRQMAAARGLPRADAQRRIDELAEGFELRDLLDRPLTVLSTGTAHKVALCQALLVACPLIVLDEPWSGLDAASRDHLDGVLRGARGAGACVVFTDHQERAAPAPHDVLLTIDRAHLQRSGTS